MRFAPFLLDPSVPPEGKPRRQHTQPGDPPSALELRGESLGITFARGRERTSYSIPALEAGEFATEHGEALGFHRSLFKAYFTDLVDVSDPEILVEAAVSAGLDGGALAEALQTGQYRQQVLDGIQWSRGVGVTAIPTFVFQEQYGIVGAQDYSVFESMMKELGQTAKK